MDEQYKLTDSQMLELIHGYIARYSHQVNMTEDKIFEKADTNFSAYEKFDELVKFAPEIAFEVILALLSQTENEDVLENLAAGPMEDLVRLHGKEFIQRFEVKASENSKFRELLSGVWQVGDPEVWSRIERLLKD
ncbi:DUF6869 domain-containing protein [Massilia scottii]|uniref:DUF6869 domain-containing protein n=1 Tax=Massilia scottii TaxID=3057166 RepID=UPI002796C814|nr:hypothetical protein [Massilia sp. CCM 9029]MDQ1835158.1 hypothetical protein [Massilia sp. CCM 9029]